MHSFDRTFERRLGRFHIGGQLLQRYPLEFLEFFHTNKILVFETVYNYCKQGHDYLAWSPNFDLVPTNEDAFNYTINANLQWKELPDQSIVSICTGILIYKSDKVAAALDAGNKIEEEAIKEYRLRAKKLQKQFLNRTTKGKKHVQQS